MIINSIIYDKILFLPYLFFICYSSFAQIPQSGAAQLIGQLKRSHCFVKDTDEKIISDSSLLLQRHWYGDVCKTTISNRGNKPLSLGNIILFEIPGTNLHADFPIYGEGFQMLHQTSGTLGHPQNIGGYSDTGHYKIKGIDERPTAYGLFTMQLFATDHLLLGFFQLSQVYRADQFLFG